MSNLGCGGTILRSMGLDYGSKTIGVSVSDELGITAQGKGTIKRTDLRHDLQKIMEYIEKYQVEEIIVGLPRNMDGTFGSRAEKTQQFVNFLNNNLDLAVKFWDERLSSREAERLLIKADLSRARRKKVIDQVAASIILQTYLDSQRINKRTGGINDE